MNLFTGDLFRNFAIGFAVGALALVIGSGGGVFSFIPKALAATIG